MPTSMFLSQILNILVYYMRERTTHKEASNLLPLKLSKHNYRSSIHNYQLLWSEIYSMQTILQHNNEKQMQTAQIQTQLQARNSLVIYSKFGPRYK